VPFIELETNMIRRRGLAVAALVSLVFSMVSCSPGGSGGSDGDSGDKVALKVWGWRQEDVAAYKKIFGIYEDAHPGVSVEYVPYKADEYDTILRTGLAGKNGPDVAQLRSYGLLQPLVASKSVLPLDDEITELGSFSDPILDGARGEKDKKAYGVPFALQTLHLIYNKKLFAKNGIEPPTTWDDMIKAFDTLKDAGVIPLAASVTDTWMLPIQHEIFGATTYGGYDYLDKMLAGKAKFTDKPWVDSLDRWTSTSAYWEPKYKGVSYADAQALFSSGQAAMFPGGIWELPVFEKANPDLELGIFNVPAPQGAPTTKTLVPGYVDGSFGVSAKTPHRKAALDLVRWMATPEFGKAFTKELHQISAVPGVKPDDALLAQALDAYLKDPSPYVTYAYFSGGDPTAWDLAGAADSNLLLGKSSAQQAAEHIQKGVDQWFKPKS
jgi:raffinose/stachyose/melibiose transport system substrate-binding protein